MKMAISSAIIGSTRHGRGSTPIKLRPSPVLRFLFSQLISDDSPVTANPRQLLTRRRRVYLWKPADPFDEKPGFLEIYIAVYLNAITIHHIIFSWSFKGIPAVFRNKNCQDTPICIDQLVRVKQDGMYSTVTRT